MEFSGTAEGARALQRPGKNDPSPLRHLYLPPPSTWAKRPALDPSPGSHTASAVSAGEATSEGRRKTVTGP